MFLKIKNLLTSIVVVHTIDIVNGGKSRAATDEEMKKLYRFFAGEARFKRLILLFTSTVVYCMHYLIIIAIGDVFNEFQTRFSYYGAITVLSATALLYTCWFCARGFRDASTFYASPNVYSIRDSFEFTRMSAFFNGIQAYGNDDIIAEGTMNRGLDGNFEARVEAFYIALGRFAMRKNNFSLFVLRIESRK